MTSYGALNIFERAWVSWFDYFQNDVLSTALIAFLMHEIVYFGRCVPFLIADHIPALQKYKLQPVCYLFFYIGGGCSKREDTNQLLRLGDIVYISIVLGIILRLKDFNAYRTNRSVNLHL